MTDIDILKDAVNTLGNVNVPVSLFETIGEPVQHVRKNLIFLLNFVVSKQNEAAKAAEETDEPVEEVPVEEMEELPAEEPEN